VTCNAPTCRRCGAILAAHPGTVLLACSSCGFARVPTAEERHAARRDEAMAIAGRIVLEWRPGTRAREQLRYAIAEAILEGVKS
jgi:predicted  nucleic acid-binding Zn-ribbon protein